MANNLTNDITDAYSIRKGPLVAALMMVAFLAAMEITITVLATPTITKDLAGFDLMSMIFSSFLIASAITTPIFGRLADRFGRKLMLSIGILIFLVGCLLCGLAQSMIMLIAFRAIQGLGAGAIFNLTYTIAGDAFPIEQRATILGALSAVWGVAGVAGPVIGGFLIEALSWHWVFFVCIPIGIVALFLLSFSLKESFTAPTYQRKRDHWSGIVTRLSLFVNIISLLSCIIMQGMDVYVTLYLQSVLGNSPMIAGLSVLPMSFSWLAASYYCGKILIRIDGRTVLIVSGIIQIISGALLVSVNQNTALPLVIFYIFLSGFGLGGLLTASTVIIQESVGFEKRGTAMGINSFVKTVGQAIGITFLGAALNMRLSSYFAEVGLTDVDPSNLFQGGTAGAALDATTLVSALESGIQLLFIIMLALTVLTVALMFLMPHVRLGNVEKS